MNRMLTKEHMEDELKNAIKNDLNTCLNLGKFKKGFEMTTGNSDINVDIREDVTVVTLNMPVTVRKDEISYREDKFEGGIKVPLGRLFEAALDIVDVETEFGEFEQLSYMLAHKGEYVIEKKRPYPDKLYILKTKDSGYIFQFFIQDEPS
ncbi:MAG: hypothetical protein HZA83_02925 [Thaumarchaeota archaeon]|nr:hypothetical protein [Nitrososphaerota archaeon]